MYKADLPYKMDWYEYQFVSQFYPKLATLMVNTAASSEKDKNEFFDLPLYGTIQNLVDAMDECERLWLEEEVGEELTEMVMDDPDSIPDEVRAWDVELDTAMTIHAFASDFKERLVQNYITPLIAANHLHEEWKKRNPNDQTSIKRRRNRPNRAGR